MTQEARSIRIGAATVTPISVGDLHADLAGWLRVPPDEQTGYEDVLGHPLHIPIQCILIQTDAARVLVDACVYELPPDSPYRIPGYQPPPGLTERLSERGVQPDQITHVVITHGHFDHLNGVTQEHDGGYAPTFPAARVYIGSADWNNPDVQSALQDGESLFGRTLGVLDRAGLLEPVTGAQSLTDEVQIIPAPGETPGHQIVRVSSGGQTLYCLGDLYHHPVEVERSEWKVHWADADSTRASRNHLVEAALAENAYLIATHIPTLGQLERSGSGVVWKEA